MTISWSILALSMFQTAASTVDPQWWWLHQHRHYSGAGAVTYVDAASIEAVENVLRVQVLVIGSSERVVERISFDRIALTTEVDCAGSRTRNVSAAVLGRERHPVPFGPGPWMTVSTSEANAIQAFVCDQQRETFRVIPVGSSPEQDADRIFRAEMRIRD